MLMTCAFNHELLACCETGGAIPKEKYLRGRNPRNGMSQNVMYTERQKSQYLDDLHHVIEIFRTKSQYLLANPDFPDLLRFRTRHHRRRAVKNR
ncbi:hypothetical protein D805_0322 [Bifidobacterium thermophilum RBL67]|uniref:Uncharacterized protein n=1 Tax=Bifidobacterium thermophilum RBL67 TaxID=1254439 RepID=M4REJ8_9BIFI|nr:hypothetical protein D805_0322 [Bifidobacterium thermophilum RBL67]